MPYGTGYQDDRERGFMTEMLRSFSDGALALPSFVFGSKDKPSQPIMIQGPNGPAPVPKPRMPFAGGDRMPPPDLPPDLQGDSLMTGLGEAAAPIWNQVKTPPPMPPGLMEGLAPIGKYVGSKLTAPPGFGRPGAPAEAAPAPASLPGQSPDAAREFLDPLLKEFTGPPVTNLMDIIGSSGAQQFLHTRDPIDNTWSMQPGAQPAPASKDIMIEPPRRSPNFSIPAMAPMESGEFPSGSPLGMKAQELEMEKARNQDIGDLERQKIGLAKEKLQIDRSKPELLRQMLLGGQADAGNLALASSIFDQAMGRGAPSTNPLGAVSPEIMSLIMAKDKQNNPIGVPAAMTSIFDRFPEYAGANTPNVLRAVGSQYGNQAVGDYLQPPGMLSNAWSGIFGESADAKRKAQIRQNLQGSNPALLNSLLGGR